MKNHKSFTRLVKLGLITWLLANTGCFSAIHSMMTREESPAERLYSEMRERQGAKEVIRLERLVHQYAEQKLDSVARLVEEGHVYTIRDYFLDYKDMKEYGSTHSPWLGSVPFGFANLQHHVHASGGLQGYDIDAVRCEIIGDCKGEEKPVDLSPLTRWFSRQYLLGLLPAFLLCLVLASQGKIEFRPLKAPLAALVYVLLWPLNFFVLLRRTLVVIDREARLRSHKESLFGRLSQREEEFLRKLRAPSSQSTDVRLVARQMFSVRQFQYRYVLALVAVLVVRVLPAVDLAEPCGDVRDGASVIVTCHDPPEPVDHVFGGPLHECAVLEPVGTPSLAIRVWQSIGWRTRNDERILVGFRRGVEHIPLELAYHEWSV